MWMDGQEGKALNIGDEGTQLTDEQKKDYAMLIYAFKDIIAVNPKAPLKEVDSSAAAVASDQKQAFRILKYILEGSLK